MSEGDQTCGPTNTSAAPGPAENPVISEGPHFSQSEPLVHCSDYSFLAQTHSLSGIEGGRRFLNQPASQLLCPITYRIMEGTLLICQSYNTHST